MHGLMDKITRTGQKHYHYEKQEYVIFPVQCIITRHMILHPIIAAILDFILNILQRWKQQQHASQFLQIQPLLKTIRK